MCEFISWIEKDDKILFLTDEQIKEREKEMNVKYPDKSEQYGHGAIMWYYGLLDNNHIQKECTDFSKQTNFPEVITNSIKQGKLSYGVNEDIARLIFNDPAFAEYNKITDPALAEYNKINDPAWAKYNKITDTALAEYKKKVQKVFCKLVKVKKNRNENWK